MCLVVFQGNDLKGLCNNYRQVGPQNEGAQSAQPERGGAIPKLSNGNGVISNIQ